MATTVTKTIRASGGDYTTLSAWEAGRQAVNANLVTADVIEVAECYDDWPSGLSNEVTVSGFTTDSTHYLLITVASGHRHDGTPQTGFYLKKTSAFAALVNLSQTYSFCEYVDAENTSNASDANAFARSADATQFRYCIGKIGSAGSCYRVTNDGTTVDPAFLCCLAWGGNTGFGIRQAAASSSYYTVHAQNCIAANCTYGFVAGAYDSNGILKNCVAYNNATENYHNTFSASSTNNATSTGSDDAPGGSSVYGITSSDFVDASNNDFHITTGSALYEAGVDLSGTFTTDIDGDTWATTWSIGFDQPAAGGGATDLTIADSTHSHAADNAVLTSSHLLTVADSAHAHSADSLSLSTGILLALSDALHAHTADNLDLTTMSVLVVAEALHSHLADNITLSLAGTESLVIADAAHAHSADNISLTSQLALSIAEATHAHTADGIVITSEHVLAVADALHAHAADNITLSDAPSLTIADSTHAHSADALTLTSASTLDLADAVHAHLADNVDLTYAATLAIMEAMHAHYADNVVLNFADLLGKAEAIFTADSERRIFTATSEQRIFKD
jgi:hypothetical protein